MNKEIERKFLIKEIPDLDWFESIYYERYFLYRDWLFEIRIQKKWDKYEFERKTKDNLFSSDKIKFEISENEFEKLKSFSNECITRESYVLKWDYNISIKIYHWKYEWFKRVEVEFWTEEEAINFEPLAWFWDEITESPLWKDSKLIELSKSEFDKIFPINNNL